MLIGLFELANHVLRDYLSADICFIARVEVDHMVDFSHDPTVTYPCSDNHGAVVATRNLYKDMLQRNSCLLQPTIITKQ